MNELKIHGHSGCGLRIVEDSNGSLLVEKSCEPSYTKRLKAQYEKQLDSAKKTISTNDIPFSTPFPLWVNNGDTGVMLMPYINAMSFIEYFERAGKDDLDNLVNALCEYVNYEMKNAEIQDVPIKKFEDKISSIYENCIDNDVVDNKFAGDACVKVSNYLDKLKKDGDTISLRIGVCHGDLTFSNILFRSSGKHSLIDFLDSFIETPLQDIVKIRQDSRYFWSLLMTTQKYNAAHVKTVMKYIDDQLVNRLKNDIEYAKYYDMFQYINILRILPYVKEKKVYDVLVEILNSIEL